MYLFFVFYATRALSHWRRIGPNLSLPSALDIIVDQEYIELTHVVMLVLLLTASLSLYSNWKTGSQYSIAYTCHVLPNTLKGTAHTHE